MASIPEPQRPTAGAQSLFRELLDRPLPAILTTLDSDGGPRSVVVWCAREEDRVAVSARDSLWLRNLQRDPRLALLVYDPGNILRYVAVRGRAVDIAVDDDYAFIDRLAQQYEGRRYQYSQPEDVARFKVSIEVEGSRTVDTVAPPGGVR